MLDLPHVASRVFGTPLMIARAKLEVILGVLAPRFGGIALAPGHPVTSPVPLTSITADGIAVVSVAGTLVARSSYLDAASGLLSYAEVNDAIATAMADPVVRGVLLDIDSPGGEVGCLFDLVERIGAIKTAADKPLWAVANESALSAAYAIASAADRLYVTRTAEVGSIGVVAVHVDESGADAKAGLAWNFVFAGEQKVDGNPHEPLSARARSTIQADVDRLYEQFSSLVAANRQLKPDAVRSTQAAIYRGELAVRASIGRWARIPRAPPRKASMLRPLRGAGLRGAFTATTSGTLPNFPVLGDAFGFGSSHTGFAARPRDADAASLWSVSDRGSSRPTLVARLGSTVSSITSAWRWAADPLRALRAD